MTRLQLRMALVVYALAMLPSALAGQGKRAATALLLSDVHLDVFHDPAKVPQLAKAPLDQWSGILSGAASATQEKDFAALQAACAVRGVDTPDALWESSLAAMQQQAAAASFVALSGDLLAHGFDCKFRHVFPDAADGEYLGFVGKTIAYVTGGLRAAFPGVPVYVAMGNNDSACGDYKDDLNSPFLREIAKTVVSTLPAADRADAMRDLRRGGMYAASLPKAVPGTRMLVLDSLFLSSRYVSCGGTATRGAASAQIAWLKAQISEARVRGEKVWVLGHIPPGVDLYATARQMTNVCGRAQPKMFLDSEAMAQVLAGNADVVRVAIFGHSHTDELRLLAGAEGAGVPVKIVSSISPVNGNRPSFTVARVDPLTANLDDYMVFAAGDAMGTQWTKEYTFSETYGVRSFTGVNLKKLTAGFAGDPTAATEASKAYLRYLFVGDRSVLLKPLWPEYVCALTHHRAAAFAKCVCDQ